MINVILIISEVIISYLSLVLIYKKYKTDGIYVYGIIAAMLSCLLNLKRISIMNIPVPLGFGITASILIGANIIIQKRGKEEFKNYLILTSIAFLTCIIVLNLSAMTENSKYGLFANASYNSIFLQNLRIYIALLVSVIVGTWLDSELYYLVKKLKNRIVLSNVFTIIITNFFENIIFIVIAYLFEYDVIDLFLCLILRYTIKTVIGLIGTIPLYIANIYD